MESIKQFRQSLLRFLKRVNDTKNKQIVEGWYRSYDPLEKYAFDDIDKAKLREQLQVAILPQLRKHKSQPIWWAASAAAILVCVFGVWFIKGRPPVPKIDYVTSSTKTAELKYLILSDSTEVWLNAASRFKYPKTFFTKFRVVDLPEGEAFFKVKRDVTRPFMVKVGGLKVTVLGTSFDINNYADLLSQTIVVNSGKVRVSAGSKILAVLEKRNQLRFNKKTHSFDLSDVDQRLSFSWRDGKTELKGANFETVASVFKNWYGVTLKSAIIDIKQFSYTATIQREVSLSDNLDLICKIHHLKYRKEGNIVTLY